MAEFFRGLGCLVLYFLSAAALVLLVRWALPMPREVMRKMLHMVCVLSIFVYYYAFSTWYWAALAALTFALAAFPAVTVGVRIPAVAAILNERAPGEVRRSLVAVHLAFAALVAVFWGRLGDEWEFIAVLAVCTWGFGDAAAALVGKAWGRVHLRLPGLDGKKTAEGSLAMFGFAFLAAFGVLLAYAGRPWTVCLSVAGVAAFVAMVVELYSRGGYDTVTVPFAVALTGYLLLGGLGL